MIIATVITIRIVKATMNFSVVYWPRLGCSQQSRGWTAVNCDCFMLIEG